MQCYSYMLRPVSEGTALITAPDPAAPMAIRPAYLKAEIDQATSIAGTRAIRRIMEQEALRPLVGTRDKLYRSLDGTSGTEWAYARLVAMQASRDKLEIELKAARENATASMSTMQEALNKANGRLSRFLNAATTFSPEPTDWLGALKLCDGNHAEASRRFGHLRAAYNQEQKQKREGKR